MTLLDAKTEMGGAVRSRTGFGSGPVGVESWLWRSGGRWLVFGLLVVAAACSSGGGVGTDAGTDALVGDVGLDIGDTADLASGDAQEVGGDAPSEDVMDVEGDVTGPGAEWLPVMLRANRTLRGLWSDGQVWFAVGDDGTIFRREGAFWTPQRSPVKRGLLAVYGETLADLYAVGEGGLVLRYVGGQWEQEDTGISGLEEIALRGVWGESGHLFVVGDKGTVLHKKGSNWAKEQSLTSYKLHTVWGSSLLDLYIGGAAGSILVRGGDNWTPTVVASGSVALQAIGGLMGAGVVAVGTGGTIVEQKLGGFSQELSNDSMARSLHGVWMAAEGDVWLVGEEGVLIHKEAGKWVTSDIAGPNNRTRSFYALRGDAASGEAIAVGEAGAGIRFDGEKWVDELVGLKADIEDLDGSAEGDGLAVGAGGVLLSWDGTGLYGIESPTQVALHGVAAFDGGYIAVGDGGAVVRVEGGTATLLEAGITEDLFGVCARAGQAVLVGKNGVVYRTSDLEEFTRVETQRFDWFRDCVIEKSGVVVAVGDAGALVRLVNEAVAPVPVATITNLRRAAIADDGTITIVGDNGLVLRGSGVTFKTVYQRPGSFLYGVTAAPEGFLAVGWGGEVVEGRGDEVLSYSIDDSGVLLQIWRDTQGALLAVGREGRAFTRKELQD